MTAEEYREKIAQMSRTMFRYCLTRTNSYHDAEDLAQEIMLISCKGEESFPNEKAFYAFVWRTADNILKSWYRHKDKRETAELDEKLSDESWEELEEKAAENEQLHLIIRELSLLNTNYRKAAVAYYFDGMSVRDISKSFGISPSMVKYLLFQSRKKIREGTFMERTFGKLSYDPIELEMCYWGTKQGNSYSGKFDDKLSQNILMCCYYDKQTEEQIALQLGVPTAYLEDGLKKLTEYGLLTEKNGFYQTNVPVITNDVFADIDKTTKQSVTDIANKISGFIDENADDFRALGFYGCDMPANTLKWTMLSLVLHLAYVDMAQGEAKLDFPTDVFGTKCFRFLAEKSASDPYGVGTSVSGCQEGYILFWDVLINGSYLHPKMTDVKADMLCRLLREQPTTENEKLVCAELVEQGLAVRTENGIMPNFPCFTREHSDKINEIINGFCWDICSDILSRTDMIGKVLLDHSPAHLADYVKKMPLLLFFRETEQIMQTLCENGWLLPMKGGMSGTTVMYLN
ncbi:sigma-70 family RNA polymerase sigma factor [Ruminococcus sp.]|uniref:RNA polymerase sigma factor n=1 Tax=Ruminococcus sp. TaxID=41978 RepID=UPI0025F1C330|nr:sigma-70 family RNA polymerase sigma factor [Ruminococcus sp.]MBQ8967807.1 sigma-70 family RNA polymerase sigma factor [Ruminococcus sp.]